MMYTNYLHELANQIFKLKMYPYFYVAHTVLCALAVREDLKEDVHTFSRKHIFSCWLSYMLMVFAGSMTANGLLGEPILTPLEDNKRILIATLSWYAVFYAPADLGYTISNFLPVKLVLSIMKEVYRSKNILNGVSQAAKLYPEAVLIIVIIGTIKGHGSGFTRLIERTIRGVWGPTNTEFLQPSFSTKASFIVSIIFLIDLKTNLIPAPQTVVFFGIVIFFVYFKLLSILSNAPPNPLMTIENMMSAILFGSPRNKTTNISRRSSLNENKSTETKKEN